MISKKEKERRKKVIERSDKAIEELNKPRKPKTDLEKVREFLEALELPYEESVNEGIRPYIFINFHKNGDAIDPC